MGGARRGPDRAAAPAGAWTPAPVRPAAGAEPDDAANTRANTWNGALQAVSLNLYNPFVGIDLIRLGGTPFEVGLLSALPPLAALSNLAGARWLSARRDPQRAGAALFAAARLLLLGFAVLNLVQPAASGLSPAWRPALLVVLIGLINLPGTVGTLAWQALLPSFLSPPRRAPALAVRGTISNLAGVATALLAGWWTRGRPGLTAYSWLYGAAALVGLAETASFLRLRGDTRLGPAGVGPSGRGSLLRLAAVGQPAPAAPPFAEAARRLWAIAPYRAYTLACLPFYLGWLMAWPLFLDYQVDVARATNAWMGAFIAVNSLAAALGNAVWNRVGARIGARLALPAACLLLVVVPLQYVFAPHLWGILVNQVLGGLFGAGVTLFLLVRLLEVAPAEDRVVAVGLTNSVLGLVGVAGPILGMGLLHVLPFPGIFWLPTALRLGGAGCLLAVGLGAREPVPA